MLYNILIITATYGRNKIFFPKLPLFLQETTIINKVINKVINGSFPDKKSCITSNLESVKHIQKYEKKVNYFVYITLI